MKNNIRELIQNAKLGDENAFNEIVKHYEHKIQDIINYYMSYNLRLISEDDIRQACYIGIYKCINSNQDFCMSVFKFMIKQVYTVLYNEGYSVRIPQTIFSKLSFEERKSLQDNFLPIESVQDSIQVLWSDKINTRIDYDKFIYIVQKRLLPRDFEIFKKYFFNGWTQLRISKDYDICRARVGQILEDFKKLCRTYLTMYA